MSRDPTATVVASSVIRVFRVGLIRWYDRYRRTLPWRGTRNAYRIWVSEIMLQQTRVETARVYYRRWMRAFPTLESLAGAAPERVLKMWEGLGYYNRVRLLHQAARVVTGEFGGRLPSSAEALQQLPGIGRYTAGAIASIAFDERAPVVDGNVARVLARVFGIRQNVKSPATVNQLYKIAERLMPARRPGDFNQAMMELGALVCLPRNARCNVCPLQRVCCALRLGLTQQLPNRGRARPAIQEKRDVAWVMAKGRVLMRQRPDTGELAGMWELPDLDTAGFEVGDIVAEARHSIMHRRVWLRVFRARCRDQRWFKGQRWRWVSVNRTGRITMPSAHRKVWAKLCHSGR